MGSESADDLWSEVRPTTLEEYVAHANRKKRGAFRVTPSGGAWYRQAPRVYQSFPVHDVARVIGSAELNHLASLGAMVASYCELPDEANPEHDSYVYVCRAGEYAAAALREAVRRNIRRARRELRYTVLDRPTLLRHGFECFRDSRARNSLSDGTRKVFERRFGDFMEAPGQAAIGAWQGDELISFFTLLMLGNFAQIGGFSSDRGQIHRPNNGILDLILSGLLGQHGIRIVSYGLSSIEVDAKTDSLHRFKLGCGFSAVPVRRVIWVAGAARWILKSPVSYVIKGAARIFPRNRLLRKALGVIARNGSRS